jgi:hypothetical protein
MTEDCEMMAGRTMPSHLTAKVEQQVRLKMYNLEPYKRERSHLLSFDILHGEHDQISIVQVRCCKRCTILEVCIAVCQLHFTHGQRSINNLDDSITQSGYQKVKRQVRDFDNGPVELPFGLFGNRGQLNRERDGIRMHTDPVGFL